MDGPALIVALKAMNPRVKIIGSSGLASHGGVTQALNEGVRHFVPKPYTAETMLKILREVLIGTKTNELQQMPSAVPGGTIERGWSSDDSDSTQ